MKSFLQDKCTACMDLFEQLQNHGHFPFVGVQNVVTRTKGKGNGMNK